MYHTNIGTEILIQTYFKIHVKQHDSKLSMNFQVRLQHFELSLCMLELLL